MTKQAKKMNIGIIPLTLILAVITFGFIMMARRSSVAPSVNRIVAPELSTPAHPKINNVRDLDAASAALDGMDPSTLNQDLTGVYQESSSF